MEYTYSVVLKSGLPKNEADFLEIMCFKVVSPQGGYLLEFRCTEIDVSNHNYIEMEILSRSNQHQHTVRVPHHYVLMIDGSESRKTLGF